MIERKIDTVHREIDRRSDDLQMAAVWFADRHPPLSSSQANGLLNLVNCEANVNTILINYIQRQASKSTARNPAFWIELKRELEGLKKQAEEIQQRIGALPQDKKKQQEQRNDIHLLLARDYVQHLVAHIIYRAALTGGK